MGIMDGKFLRGTVGGTIFKKRHNKQIVQGKSKKKQIDMTVGSYDAAFVFGRASTLASNIRTAISNITPFYDGNMISRFTGECNYILQQATTDAGKNFNFSQDAFNRLNGFEFNLDSPVRKYLFAQPLCSFDGTQLNINVPEMNIPNELRFPERARYCIIAFHVCLLDLENNLYKSQEIQSFEVEWSLPSYILPARQLSFEAAAGCLHMVSLGLFYMEKTFAGNAVINRSAFSPSAILKADFCPGEIVQQSSWTKIEYNARKKRSYKKPNIT